MILYIASKMVSGVKLRDKEFFVFIGIAAFYLTYSLIRQVNVIPAAFHDLQQQMKPYIAFYAVYCMKPQFTKSEMKGLLLICYLLFALLIAVVFTGNIEPFFIHPTNLASAAVLLSFVCYYCLKDSFKNNILVILILAIGLFSLRSKFYGVFVCFIFITYFIKNEIKLSPKYIIVGGLLVVATLFFVWEKFFFYYVEGLNSEELARPMLFQKSTYNLNGYFPFGPGLGTYACEASRIYYSPLYDKYDLSYVWGLSRGNSDFVADTFYPTLTQFGYIGIFLFILFWIRRYKSIATNYRITKDLKQYKLGLFIIIFFIIESVADTTFLSNRCVAPLMLLALSMCQMQSQSSSTNINTNENINNISKP
ncbi:MAG: hypothetical protein ACK5M3_12405 [Dysgonomonas sp.]